MHTFSFVTQLWNDMKLCAELASLLWWFCGLSTLNAIVERRGWNGVAIVSCYFEVAFVEKSWEGKVQGEMNYHIYQTIR